MSGFRDLAMRPPALSVAEASRLGREVFGLDGPAVDLGSHQDRNVRIGGHVLKIANASWATSELELQDAAMRHAADRLPAVVPAPVSDAIAEVEHGGERLRLRALPYLPGVPLRTRAHLSRRTLCAAGELAGRVAAALESFDHRAAARTLQWDVRRAGEVVEAYADAIEDADDRGLAERAVRTLPGDLPQQVIHGDVTVWNTLADVADAGRLLPRRVIDFGDCGRSWRAAECAVLAASVCAHQPARVLQDAAAVVAGFHAALPLDADELAAMHALIAARAALSLAGGAHQAALDPGNGYVAEGLAIASRGLRAITAVPPPVAHAAFRLACGLEAPVHAPRPVVQVGYGRLGHHFWAFEQQGVVPDIVTLAKATGNGHPVAAVITTAAIADEFARHEDLFASVGGGPVSCEVGLAVLDVLEDEQLQANARAVGGYLTSRLAPLAGELPLVHALHGMGLYRGLELRRADGGAARDEAPAIRERMLELGVIVQPTGPEGNVLKLKPPLCVAIPDVDHLAAALEETLASGW